MKPDPWVSGRSKSSLKQCEKMRMKTQIPILVLALITGSWSRWNWQGLRPRKYGASCARLKSYPKSLFVLPLRLNTVDLSTTCIAIDLFSDIIPNNASMIFCSRSGFARQYYYPRPLCATLIPCLSWWTPPPLYFISHLYSSRSYLIYDRSWPIMTRNRHRYRFPSNFLLRSFGSARNVPSYTSSHSPIYSFSCHAQ